MKLLKKISNAPSSWSTTLLFVAAIAAMALLMMSGSRYGARPLQVAAIVLLAVAAVAYFVAMMKLREIETAKSEVENNSLELAIGISEVFESLNMVRQSGDMDQRVPETASNELLLKLSEEINKLLDRLGELLESEKTGRASIHARVDHLLGVMEELKHGNLDARADEQGATDEIGRLCAGINDMIQNMQETRNEMDAINMDLALSLSENFEVLKSVADGDLSRQASSESNNELLQKLGVVINDTIRNLQGLIGKMREVSGHIGNFTDEFISTTEQVNQGAHQIAVSVQDMARGSENQSNSVRETSRVLQSLLETIDQIAKGSLEQNRSVERTSEIVNEMSTIINTTVDRLREMMSEFGVTAETARGGSNAIEDAINNITKLKATVEDASAMVERLGDSSRRIGEITDMIDDMAEQTNLLALNAAIEAGRAGEHGKGFAVVAAEVRKLAERSAKATKQISDLISEVQQDTGRVIEGMREGNRQVEEGASLGEKARSSLTEILKAIESTDREIKGVSGSLERMVAQNQQIVESMDSVAAIVQENTAATEEMAAGSKQVEESMKNVLTISQDNAAAAEEISASTEEQTASISEIASTVEALNAMAGELEELTNKFKVE